MHKRGRTPDGIVFDYDGVLLEYWPRAWEAIPSILHYLNLDVIVDDFDIEVFRGLLKEVSIGRALMTLIPAFCEKHQIPEPSRAQIIEALIDHEITHGDPVDLSEKARRGLKDLNDVRSNPSNDLSFMGILSNRSYSTAMHHMQGAQQELIFTMDVMQFARSQWYERYPERIRALIAQHNSAIIIQKNRKPNPRVFLPFERWMNYSGYLLGFSNDDPFIALYVGDTLTDFEAVKRVNRLFSSLNKPLRFYFIPACIGGPIQSEKEWLEDIDTPSLAGPAIYSIEDLHSLMLDYASGQQELPHL